MEVIGQYFFPETEAQKVTAEILPNPMTRTEATDYIDTIRAAIRKCAENPDGNRGKEMYTLLFGMDKAKIQSVKEYIVNANDKDLAQLLRNILQKPSISPCCPKSPMSKHSRQE